MRINHPTIGYKDNRLDMEKQYTVKEVNTWEGETFNYVLSLKNSEYIQIRGKIDLFGQGLLSIEETNFTDKEIQQMNERSSNNYMDFIAKYSLKENALESWSNFGDCFYKGVGLTKEKFE